jgi:hypothetical protein
MDALYRLSYRGLLILHSNEANVSIQSSFSSCFDLSSDFGIVTIMFLYHLNHSFANQSIVSHQDDSLTIGDCLTSRESP